jgi:hypothetical protein
MIVADVLDCAFDLEVDRDGRATVSPLAPNPHHLLNPAMSSAAFSFEFDQFALAHQQETTTQRKPQVYPFDLFQPTQDIIAATPDSFDFDLDLSLSTEDSSALQLLSVDPNPAFHFVRPETAKPGPLSTFTVSSESAYESLSSQSESLYRSSYSQASYAASDFSFPLDMDFDRIRLDTMSEYGSSYGGSAYNVPQPTAVDLDAAVGFGLPPSPPYSPDSPKPRQESFSDYESPFTANPAASPNMSISPSASLTPELEDKDTDPRKKYKCNVCPRGLCLFFDRSTLY